MINFCSHFAQAPVLFYGYISNYVDSSIFGVYGSHVFGPSDDSNRFESGKLYNMNGIWIHLLKVGDEYSFPIIWYFVFFRPIKRSISWYCLNRLRCALLHYCLYYLHAKSANNLPTHGKLTKFSGSLNFTCYPWKFNAFYQ